MILSRAEIEMIGATFLRDFERTLGIRTGNAAGSSLNAMPIERFATDYLKLDVSMTELSTDGSVCGLTAYADTAIQVEGKTGSHIIPLKKNQVLLDSHLDGTLQTGRRRFTLAHECAHQILFLIEDAAAQKAMQHSYSKRTSYCLRELKTHEDWNEWQANALGAALLMPPDRLKQTWKRLCQEKPVKCCGNRLDAAGEESVRCLCRIFEVSRTAMLIRLRQIGAVEEHPLSEYYKFSSDPLEIWP